MSSYTLFQQQETHVLLLQDPSSLVHYWIKAITSPISHYKKKQTKTKQQTMQLMQHQQHTTNFMRHYRGCAENMRKKQSVRRQHTHVKRIVFYNWIQHNRNGVNDLSESRSPSHLELIKFIYVLETRGGRYYVVGHTYTVFFFLVSWAGRLATAHKQVDFNVGEINEHILTRFFFCGWLCGRFHLKRQEVLFLVGKYD